MFRVKANNSNLKVDLYVNGELLDQNDDRKLISQLAIRDKTVSVFLMSSGPMTSLCMCRPFSPVDLYLRNHRRSVFSSFCLDMS